jgi:NAD(P)-dependent dehydrogenase (short-subunit alcohol dehydrogenase family)
MPNASTALITGANKGIGLKIARELGKRGFSIWLGCRDQNLGEKAAARLREPGLQAHAVVLDVTNRESVQAAAKRVAENLGALDVLVNSAGRQVEGATLSEEFHQPAGAVIRLIWQRVQ